ncbi:hydroxyethylthiazole kinase [Natrarchaeobius chitinivorans]|uniref:Hydroxyethylthiazole kinase n=1 Tax=Natrarchaeobius chitinivorans TaxID=1679083 RepID=A0A3N6LZK8_NATCH|nr:hydroxyethylthiazole kinase [Natrarchaeobius chitinivorans]RQG94647.1 hydroxyethylthiazole kinase [Natrarchaeobius chitinivorans]
MSDSIDVTPDELGASLRSIAETEPLVQSVTNEVTMNDVANLILHWGALPVMADSPGDAEEMADIASALLINIGQIPETKVEAALEAGSRGSDRGVPIVLDPVGVGATPSRDSVAKRLLSDLDFSIIKGNYGEISALAGVEAEVKGVESVGDYEEIERTARSLADSTGATVVASGVEDIVADSDSAYRLTAGHGMLGEIVGTGCMLGGTLAVFDAALEDSHAAALQGTLAFDVAGERATELPHDGPASYRTNFHDTVAGFTPEAVDDLDLSERVERVV